MTTKNLETIEANEAFEAHYRKVLGLIIALTRQTIVLSGFGTGLPTTCNSSKARTCYASLSG